MWQSTTSNFGQQQATHDHHDDDDARDGFGDLACGFLQIMAQQENDDTGDPLSWDEARSRLRSVLEDYLDEPLSNRRTQPDNDQQALNGDDLSSGKHTKTSEHTDRSILSWWISHNLDLYFGALSVSAALLILACFSLTSRQHQQQASSSLHPQAPLNVYIAQVAGSVLLTVGSLLSLWMIRRRKYLCLNDSENAKRREVLRFLRNFDHETVDLLPSSSNHASSSHHSTPQQITAASSSADAIELPGTSLTDIYPVYRRLSEEGSYSTTDGAAWSRIPSLLLVEGDLVALQVGDSAPADCDFVESFSSSNGGTSMRPSGSQVSSPLSQRHFKAGQPISLEAVEQTSMQVVSQLPQGRVTLPVDSDHLLTLCNHMRIYRVASTPLYEFIRRPAAVSRSSQTSRKITEMRKALSVAGFLFLALTAIIVFARPGVTSSDLSLILPLPLLAAVGVFPVVAPAFAFALEMLGTSRVLTTVHPYASLDKVGNNAVFPHTQLLFRYITATILTRLSLWEAARRLHDLAVRLHMSDPHESHRHVLVRVPPASLNLLEKLGVATAFALIDDELACEPHAMPQQLLIPSAKGLKLLDLCPAFEEDSDAESESDTVAGRKRGTSLDSDSSEEGTTAHNYSSLRRKFLNPRNFRRRRTKGKDDETEASEASSIDVQFEDPTWWQHLPTLKCIGLAGLVMDDPPDGLLKSSDRSLALSTVQQNSDTAKLSLIQLVCSERRSHQLQALAECIGFSTEPNSFGDRGDLSPFTERLRLHVLSRSMFQDRLERDSHDRSSEQSRWWGLIRPDATSVIVQDSRSGAHQLLTVGDPAVVMNLCNEAWQGEISTIIPLSTDTRQMVMETTNSWKLGDLDVTAFSYSPVSRTLEATILGDDRRPPQRYLLDQHTDPTSSMLKDKSASKEWTIIRNQVFLGILGSLLVPRREIQNLLRVLNDAGVRFTYFSPRNMRRQKELASQMGIDVAWNCAISLRPLESGEEDEYRMVSNYADWDVNARLPHGVDDVRKHLEEVDNVPLLVSLFTDVTKQTTCDMVEIFQEYNDTVIAIGISHLPHNDSIFSKADIAVGIDVLTDGTSESCTTGFPSSLLRPSELEFVSAISSHSCAFKFRGASSLSHIATIIESSRAALEAATSAGLFLTSGCVSFSVFVLFSACAPSTTLPAVPILGSVLYLQVILPLIGFAIAMSDGEPDCMKRVPPKNDVQATFARREGTRLYGLVLVKSIPAALLPQLIFLISFGVFELELEPDLVTSSCPGATSWVHVIRCPALKYYSGTARTSAGAMSLAHFVLNAAIASTSFVYRFASIRDLPPWHHNIVWVGAVVCAVTLTAVYLALTIPKGVAAALPWYYYVLAIVSPFVCLIWNEYWKRREAWHERRSEKLRRLQFETRLGAWSPK